MAVITPTYTDLRWGPKKWQLFDYKAHPTRDANGNPCLILLHQGGGMGGDKTDNWQVTTPYNTYLEYLLSASRAVHFDIISMEYGCVDHSGGSLARSESLYLHDSILDVKTGIAAIKALGLRGINGSTNYINPTKIISGGHSHGATLAPLACLTAPVIGYGGQKTAFQRFDRNDGFDSTVRGVFIAEGQVDVSAYGGVDYMRYDSVGPGWIGHSVLDGGAEWATVPASIRESMSVRRYISNGDTGYYKPFFTFWRITGGGAPTYPLTNSHHSQQLLDLNATLSAAGLPYGTLLFNAPLTEDQKSQVYTWMATQVSS